MWAIDQGNHKTRVGRWLGLLDRESAPVPSAPTRLHWTFQQGPEDTDYDEDPDDIGPARICRSDGTEEPVNGGGWITRAEALRLATQFGYELDEDG
jgi:hypothetical protein